MPTLWEMGLGAQIRWIDAAGVRTRIVEQGAGTPLILLHGTGGHVEAWFRNLGALAAHYRVIAIDSVGHGLTDKPAIAYTPADYAAHARDVMDALGIERAHFAGVSLGAWVASWLALESPERVLSIINNTGAVFRWPEGEDQQESSGRRNMVSTSAGLEDLTIESVRRRLHLLFHDPSKCPEELVRVRYALYSTPEARAVTAQLHHLLPYDSPDRIAFSLTPERLQALSMPVLYLWGEFNPGGSVESGKRAASTTPRGEFAVIDGVGHWPQFEGADEFNRLALDFLARVEASNEGDA
jgi:pimeloyl-ACP methyl ester carboxylesterase